MSLQAITEGLRCLPTSKEICSGTIPCLPPIRIVQDAKSELLDKPLTLRFPLSTSHCKRLIGLGAKTPFGKGKKTLQDDQVRLGWQLEPRQMAFTASSSPFSQALASSSDLMQSIRLTLCPDAESVSAEFYKLVVYGEGGHFVKHRDTLRSANHVGTLLIGLPTEEGFEGGELVVDRRKDKPLKLTCEHWNRDDLSSSYAAFFTDSEHELRAITKGYRLTLMYNIMSELDRKRSHSEAKNNKDVEAGDEKLQRKKQRVGKKSSKKQKQEEKQDQEQPPQSQAADASANHDHKALVDAVTKMLQEMPAEASSKPSYRSLPGPAQHIGFMLQHQYSLSNAKPEYLRGRDAVLYALLANLEVPDGEREPDSKARLSVRLETVKVEAEREFQDTDLMEDHRAVEVRLNGVRISQFDLDLTQKELEEEEKWDELDEDELEEHRARAHQPYNQSGQVRFVGEVVLDQVESLYHVPANEYTGNEAAPEQLAYNRAVLIVSLASNPFTLPLKESESEESEDDD